jgi:hypothetical protein
MHVSVVLSDRQPVPVVRLPPGECVEVTVPRSPFRHTQPETPKVVPAGRLGQIADSLRPNGSRRVVYLTRAPGAATLSSTVGIHTRDAIPVWSAVVLVT